MVEKLAVRARAHLVDHGRLEVHEDRARHVLARARLAEERVERIVAAADRLVRGHLTVRLDAVLEAEELPARVTHLETGLADLTREARTVTSTPAALTRSLIRAFTSCNVKHRTPTTDCCDTRSLAARG